MSTKERDVIIHLRYRNLILQSYLIFMYIIIKANDEN